MPDMIKATESLYYHDHIQNKKDKGTGSPNLDKDAFLKLLLTQLQNQDPLNPLEDKEFIAQMAQFSSLEQMTNMNENLQKFMDLHRKSDFVSHSDLIGRKIEWEKILSKDELGKPTESEILTGTVTSVVFKDGQAQLVIDGTTKVQTGALVSVSNRD
jgi:flagellar basal-body rod modification protein FlgD